MSVQSFEPKATDKRVARWIESMKEGDVFEASYIDKFKYSGDGHIRALASHIRKFKIVKKYRRYMQVAPVRCRKEICYVNYIDLFLEGAKTLVWNRRGWE